MTMEELMSLLAEHDIDPHELAWGTGEARTPDKLLTEVNAGECELISIPDGLGRKRLIRRTNVLMIEVYFDLRKGRRLALVETAHVRNLRTFASPKSFVNRKLDVTLTEKGMRGETTFEGTIRALLEELRIDGLTPEDTKNLFVASAGEMFEKPLRNPYLAPVEVRTLIAQLQDAPSHPPWMPQQLKYVGIYPSVSYPGILTESKAHRAIYVMRNRDQLAIGYHDRDGDKLTTYDWRDTALRSRR